MSRHVIAETTLGGLRPVGVGQRRTLDAWDQIVAFLEHDGQLGPDHAALFAEPVVDENGVVEWYAPRDSESEAVPVSSLPEAEQESVRAEAARLTDAISARADALRESMREEDKRLGETLATALFVPEDTDVLYVQDGRPVLVNWGTLKDVAAPRLSVLDEVVRPRAPEPVRPPPPPILRRISRILVDRRWRWWNLLWVLFALLVTAIMALLLWGCALGIPFGNTFLSYCPQPPTLSDDLAAERRRGVELQAEIDRLEDQLADLPRCVPREPPPPPPPRVVPEPTPAPAPTPEESEFDRRREEAGGSSGDITVTLIWDGDSDLDLVARCPDGSQIDYTQRSSCGGELDVDANNQSSSIMPSPVENVFWPDGEAAPGVYRVFVDNYEGRSAGNAPVPFQVRVSIGSDVQEFSGEVAEPGGAVPVTEFTIE
ncbi:hypothetical protein C882_2335 [Caenispirillum salinarum AK4]|uniref:Uncharacterized protein n=1 Tax=Caenispirillum salinarum AK4 TaxID=1238182 RepID=K9HPQ8_9PROT|nr:hypothetical protein [Caenispirillum salinarum]EKV32258.1 hypothetical protein C882_2335 [Caenispirillum salinarum AK4]